MSKAYEAAYKKSGEAIRTFKTVQEAYRSRKIGDAEFLRGKAAYDKAMAAYDAAYAKEQARGNPRGSRGKFARCVEEVQASGSAYDPRAVCAASERKAYGQAELTRRAIAGKRRAARGNRPISHRYFARLGSSGQYEIVDTHTGQVVRGVKTKSAAIQALASMNAKALARGEAYAIRNPADAAERAYEIFHGEPPSESVTVTEQIHYHKHLFSIGDLESLVIRTVDRTAEIKLKQFKGAYLAANEQAFEELARNRKVLAQLFIKGGDQSVNLADFGIDPDRSHEVETLGRAIFVGYETNKVHLGDEGGEALYLHKFKTTRGAGDFEVKVYWARYPDVIYRVLDQHLEFSGGSYELIAEGINL